MATLKAEIERAKAPTAMADWQLEEKKKGTHTDPSANRREKANAGAAPGVTFRAGPHAYERALEALRRNPLQYRRFTLTPLCERDRVVATFTMAFEDAVVVRRLGMGQPGAGMLGGGADRG